MAMSSGCARLVSLSAFGTGAQQLAKLMCLLRCLGATEPFDGFSTVMRLSWRCPRTLEPAKVPGPSKRTSFSASEFETYTFPFDGWTTLLNRVVPTPANWLPTPPTATGGLAIALIANTSLSGSEERTESSQLRRSSSTQWLPLNLTMSPVSGAGTPKTLVLGL